jgi:REP element-mobilizing transposase RayT
MTNHVHLIFNVPKSFKPELVLGDIKRFSSKRLTEAIQANPLESRKDWMMQQFRAAAQYTSNTTQHQFWQHDNHPTELWSDAVIREKVRYIHNNPVEAGLVIYPKDYLYSSAMDYAGEKGLLKGVEVLDQMYDWKSF